MKWTTKKVKLSELKSWDKVFELMIKLLIDTDALTVAMAQSGDYIGGHGGKYGKTICLFRKAMNSFFCRTDRPFKFYGMMNDDVNMYLVNGIRGEKIFTVNNVFLQQRDTQTNKGGLTDIYLAFGTYVKSFYSVMYEPAVASISMLNTAHKRVHHRIDWELAAPKIISEAYKK